MLGCQKARRLGETLPGCVLSAACEPECVFSREENEVLIPEKLSKLSVNILGGVNELM